MNEIVTAEQFVFEDENTIVHVGVKHRSGRYPEGSGENPYQHCKTFHGMIKEMKRDGLTEVEIARNLGISTTQLRAKYQMSIHEERINKVQTAKSLMEKCGGNVSEVARQMGINESSVRSLLDEDRAARVNASMNATNFLKDRIEAEAKNGKIGIDISLGTEHYLGVSKDKMKEVKAILEEEGYKVIKVQVPNPVNETNKTTIEVLCPPGTKPSDVKGDYNTIGNVSDFITYDGGETFHKAFEYPTSLDSKRLKIHYADEKVNGFYGEEKDGVIEIRRGVEDLSLGNSNYAQVRIMVDGTHYLKGMAVYSDNLPDGVDVMFNTNKKSGTPMEKVLKEVKPDPDNPFGALIKEHGGQSYYTDENGVEHLSCINKTREEGDWNDWTNTVASQFLSKQNKNLIKRQIDISIEDREQELKEIMALENPTIKRELLQDFADNCDSTAVHLETASFPRQRYQVILPMTTIKDNEIYAPNYENGEEVVLVRYPHGGTFEIPRLIVNNNNKEAREVLGTNAKDAVGINSKTAAILSGADFDGDTVMVIPSGKNGIHITNREPLEGLKDFDPKTAYPYVEGMKMMKYEKVVNGKTIKVDNTQKQMGEISNLITDMHIKGATDDELARAVRHSMVVIDAGKHKLNYKLSEAENGIAALKKQYQGHYDEDGKLKTGASTLISSAKSQVQVEKRVGSIRINQKGKPWYDPSLPEGANIYKTSHEEYIDPKTGKTRVRTTTSTKMAEARDAHTLSTGTIKEEMYADYANKMKDLANQARKEKVYTGNLKYSPEANKKYKKEVDSLDAQVKLIEMQKPLSRKAQIIANVKLEAITNDNPHMDKKERKKEAQKQLNYARASLGIKRKDITFTDREWEAIQAGAISDNKLTKIIKYSNKEDLRKRATPKAMTTLSQSKINRLLNMVKSGKYTNAQIASQLGVSTSTVMKYAEKEGVK